MDDYEIKMHKELYHRDADKKDNPFDWRSYSMFGFLADVRNYNQCEPIAKPKFYIPKDCSDEIRKEYEWGHFCITFVTLHITLQFKNHARSKSTSVVRH